MSNRSEAINELVAALCKAQQSFGAVLKDAENPAYSRGERKSMYATLDSVIAATRKPLAENGLAIIALPHEISETNRLSITSMLVHSSGQFIESTLTMAAVERVTPQEIGKLITYARRYQWTSLTGTAPEDDDDANASSGVGSKQAAQSFARQKIEEATGPVKLELVEMGDVFALAGHGVAVIKSEMTESEKKQFDFKYNGALRAWMIPAAHAHSLAALCQKHKIEVVWKENAQV